MVSPPPTPAGPSAAAPAPAATAHPLPDHIVTEALAARRPAFESCVRGWLRDDPKAGLSGRRITISLIVNPTGLVSSSTIDDPSLEATSLGACLRGAASRPFPSFEGEPIQVMVPLRLGQ